MRSSALPPRMQSHEIMADERRQAWQQEVYKQRTYSFHPETHEVPDFEAIHKRDQLEMHQCKTEHETTSSVPFQLRTTERSRQKLESKLTNAETENIMKPKRSKQRPVRSHGTYLTGR